MPVAGISTTIISTASFVAKVWMTNQSCRRLAAFLMTDHHPRAPGVSSLDFDKSDMAILTKNMGLSYGRAKHRVPHREPAYSNSPAVYRQALPIRLSLRQDVTVYLFRTSPGRGAPRGQALSLHRHHAHL